MNTTWFSEATVNTLLAALPVFGRVLGLVVSMPLFGERRGPAQVRVGLAVVLTVLFVHQAPTLVSLNMLQRAAIFGAEMIIGLAIGFVVKLVFTAAQIAGQFMDTPMGLGMSEVLDTSGMGRVPLFGQFYYFLVAQVFFAFDGHLAVLRALGDSFQLVPIGTAIIGEDAGEVIFRAFGEMFAAGVRVAAPVLAAIFATDAALAIANRAVQQLNIFSVGFSVKTIVGLEVVIAALPFLVAYAAQMFHHSGVMLQQIYGYVNGLR
jgi:flagellar biosynthetic protein FliR